MQTGGGSLTIRPTIRCSIRRQISWQSARFHWCSNSCWLGQQTFPPPQPKEMEEQLLGLVCISHLCSLALHKNIPMSNHDLIEWCEYLRILINNVLSRGHNVPHKQVSIIYLQLWTSIYVWKPLGCNLYMYVKDNSGSFGMPCLLKKMNNHAKKLNLTLAPEWSNNIKTATCGHFCLYFCLKYTIQWRMRSSLRNISGILCNQWKLIAWNRKKEQIVFQEVDITWKLKMDEL